MSTTFRRIVISARRLDALAAAQLCARLEEEWRRGVRVIALDLSGVEEIDSMGISALVVQNRKRPFGARIVLCHLTDYVRDVVEVTQLHRIFDVFDSGDAAEFALSA